MIYALIDATPALIRTQDFESSPPALSEAKGLRWVRYEVVTATPGADQARDADASGLEEGAWVVRQHVRPLTESETEDRRLSALKESDNRDMGRIVEDVLVAVALSGGVSLTRDSFPAAVWEKINARRALRGLESV
jgi:hypothetical protein